MKELIPRSVKLPEMPEEDKEALKEAGRDPANWITYSMLAQFWGVTEGHVRGSRCKGKLPKGIKLKSHVGSDKVYLPAKCAYGPYLPVETQRLLHKIRMSNLGDDDLDLPQEQTAVRHSGDIEKTLRQVDYLKSMAQCVSLDDWREVVQRALKDAMDGDRYARKWLGDYLVGKPIQRTESVVKHKNAGFSEEERAELLKSMIFIEHDEGLAEEEDEPDTGIIEGTYTDSK